MLFQNNNIIKQQLDGVIPKPGKTGVDWFLFCYFLDKFNQTILEIGVGNGGSTFSAVALSSDVTVIDSWDHGWAKENVDDVLSMLNKKVKFINSRSEVVTVDDLEQYSFIHLDANKTYNETINDLTLCSKICSGIICVDDYMNSMWPEVTWAVDDFIKQTPSWRKIFIGNHQIFLSSASVNINNIKHLIVDFPIISQNNIFYITYGQFPDYVMEFIKNGKMSYSWQQISTATDKSTW